MVVSAKTSLKVTPGTSLKKKPKPIIAKPPKAIKTKATIVPKPKIVKPLDMTKAQAVLGFTIKLNDLKLVEGIGPKIEGLLHKAGIRTWLQLSSTKPRLSRKFWIRLEIDIHWQTLRPGRYSQLCWPKVNGQDSKPCKRN